MNINSAFPSNYLKAADLRGGRVTVVIDSVAIENIGDEDKPIVYFQGKEKGLVLNKTNANMIAEIAKSEETDNWHDVRVTLYSCKVDFQGRRVDAIRVDYPPAPSNLGRAIPAATRAEKDGQPEPPAGAYDNPDSVPF